MNQSFVITEHHIGQFADHMREQERSDATILKYVHSLRQLRSFLDGTPVTKAALIEWKQRLIGRYAPASVNSVIAAANSFFRFMESSELFIRPLRIQKSLFLDENKELTRCEYTRLVEAAERRQNRRLSLVIQTICATGIRVSELRFITAEAVRLGRAEISGKGKRRVVFLPQKLRRQLMIYLKKQKTACGPVFVTGTGKPLDRSNIWRDMKALCVLAGIDPCKVFPHNLRHLFARTYYSTEKDLSRLADILGHSNVNTTRIYTAESGAVHARQIERMELIIT